VSDVVSGGASPGLDAAAFDRLELDHLVVAAATLAEGVAWCEATFGRVPEAGGKHPLMGTHNRIFGIGSKRFPRAYFEIIAIDPEAAVPSRPRWFGLDEPALRRALAEGPRLIHWVARCADVAAVAAAFRAEGIDPGTVVEAERSTPRGLLRWRITVRPDGRCLGEGALPTLIEWSGVHPAASLPPSGIELAALTLASEHVPDALFGRLAAAAGVERAPPGAPALRAVLDTPRGRITLDRLRPES
jgi:hypothetical protein